MAPSWFGARLYLTALARVDTLRILSSAGRIISTHAWPEFAKLGPYDWCPDGRHLTASATVNGVRRPLLLDTRDGTYRLVAPAAIEVAAGFPVLSQNGDGRYADPTHTRAAFDLSDGATLEFGFRLGLSRPDRQRILVCLHNGSTWRGDPEHPGTQEGGRLCLTWPQDEFDRRREDQAELLDSRIGFRESFAVPSSLAQGGWTDAALQIQPDGLVQVYLNRDLVFTSRFSFRSEPGERYRITLAGAAADANLYFRDVYLWRDARF